MLPRLRDTLDARGSRALLDNHEQSPNTEITSGQVRPDWETKRYARQRTRGSRHFREQCVAWAQESELCLWPGCGQVRANRLSNDYGLAPLCVGHFYEVWRQARDLAEHRENHSATRLVPAPGGDLDDERVNVEQPVAQVGWICYLRIGEHIKIGYASRLLQRLRSYPPTAELLAAHRGTKVDEKVTHSLLYLHRVAGREWYDPHPEVLDYIAKIVVRYGEYADPRPAKPVLTGQPVQMRRRSGARSSRR
jgi:hypothetical protein